MEKLQNMEAVAKDKITESMAAVDGAMSAASIEKMKAEQSAKKQSELEKRCEDLTSQIWEAERHVEVHKLTQADLATLRLDYEALRHQHDEVSMEAARHGSKATSLELEL